MDHLMLKPMLLILAFTIANPSVLLRCWLSAAVSCHVERDNGKGLLHFLGCRNLKPELTCTAPTTTGDDIENPQRSVFATSRALRELLALVIIHEMHVPVVAATTMAYP